MDEIFLNRALALASASVPLAEGGPFGAVVVRDGAVIGEGWNRVVATKDPTAHAEVLAIRAACAEIGHFHLDGCVLYASSEPCPLCLAAAYWAHIARIVYANPRQEAAAIGFCDHDLFKEMCLPEGSRRIPASHLPVPRAREPLERWLAFAGRTPY